MPSFTSSGVNIPNVHIKSKNGGKSQEDFPLINLDQLLCTVIETNPYMVPKNKIGTMWGNVRGRV
jgi:hypothetical protein